MFFFKSDLFSLLFLKHLFNSGKANEPSDLEALDSGVQDIMRTAGHMIHEDL